ncbi:antigen WC1.1-like [Odontesthes bonariensis]|uniref:antigen WC1.1-like n=1 Tax=Odontesthes bonariensis TaxID=219752 RepID=UPI003F580C87
MDHTALLLLLSLCGSGLWAEHTAGFHGEVRLAGGGGRCAGRLEVKDEGNWMAVDDALIGFVWTLRSAAAVCRQLDCGSVVSFQRIRPPSDSPKPLHSVLSSLNLFRIHPIPVSSVEITCSDSVRLVDGADLCSGRLEVKSNLSWSSVSAAAFDQQDAAVVCRELNCGAPSVLQGALYGESDTVLNKEFRCEGQELALLDCDSSVRQHAGPAVGLNCSEPEDVRLVGGSRCAGTLELRRRGEWKPAYTDSWTLQFAGEVCRQLDCGSAVSTRKRKTPEQDMWRLTPDCGDSGILTCATKLRQAGERDRLVFWQAGGGVGPAVVPGVRG